MKVGTIKHALARILLVFVAGITPCLSQAELVIIGNRSIAADKVTTDEARKIWLGKLRRLSGSGKLSVVDHAAGSEAYTEFYSKVVKKKPSQLKAYWAKRSFTGKGFPPEQLASDAAVVEWVAGHENGLGYVDSASVTDAVKILLRVN